MPKSTVDPCPAAPSTGTSTAVVRCGLLVALTVVLLGSCSRPPGPVLMEPEEQAATRSNQTVASSIVTSTSTSSPAAASDESTESEPSTSTSVPASTDAEVPAGLITATGVVVPVVDRIDDGYLVRTPCGVETELSWGQPLTGIAVVLDPGHGGVEPGARGEQIDEAAINLAIARRTAVLLNERGIATVLTRTGDYRMPVEQRTALADDLGARALVSIHHNTPAVNVSPGPGTEVYVQSTSTDSRRLGGLLYESTIEALSSFDVRWVGRSDAGVLTVLDDEGDDAYGINRRPRTPSALVEVAYLGNPDEEALIVTDEYVRAVSEATADGIDRYLRSDDDGSGHVDTPRRFNPSNETGGSGGCVDPVLE